MLCRSSLIVIDSLANLCRICPSDSTSGAQVNTDAWLESSSVASYVVVPTQSGPIATANNLTNLLLDNLRLDSEDLQSAEASDRQCVDDPVLDSSYRR